MTVSRETLRGRRRDRTPLLRGELFGWRKATEHRGSIGWVRVTEPPRAKRNGQERTFETGELGGCPSYGFGGAIFFGNKNTPWPGKECVTETACETEWSLVDRTDLERWCHCGNIMGLESFLP